MPSGSLIRALQFADGRCDHIEAGCTATGMIARVERAGLREQTRRGVGEQIGFGSVAKLAGGVW